MEIITRRVLESNGCDNRAMLEAVCGKLGEEVDIADQLIQDKYMEEQFGSIAAVFREHFFITDISLVQMGLKWKTQI